MPVTRRQAADWTRRALEAAVTHGPAYIAQVMSVAIPIIKRDAPKDAAVLLGALRAHRARRRQPGTEQEAAAETHQDGSLRRALGADFDALLRQRSRALRSGHARAGVHSTRRDHGRNMTEHPTGTVTFLFTDIEGSTRRWQDEPEDDARVAGRTRRDLARRDRQASRTLVQAHRRWRRAAVPVGRRRRERDGRSTTASRTYCR